MSPIFQREFTLGNVQKIYNHNLNFLSSSTATPVRSYTPQGKRRILESKDQLSWKDVAAISPVKPNLQG